jgi:transposase
MLQMDQVHVIRHKVLVERVSRRRVAQEMGVSRNTVRRYLSTPAPKYGPRPPGKTPVRDAAWARIQTLLAEAPRWTGGKQRLTATRLHAMLVGEGMRVGVTTVKELVAEWKRQRREVFVPLVYAPGDLGEVDFFEVLADVADRRQKAWMFVMRLMHSGRDFAWLYDRQDQVSFLDGHVRAFAHFGAVPQRLAYDNLRAAVQRILVGSERQLAARFEALASHYLFEPSFCRPRTGHDKGGVESRGKAIRWQHLVPIPSGPTLDEINRALLTRIDAALDGQRDGDGHTAADRFAVERGHMLPLPAQPFDARATRFATVSRRSLVVVEGATYSVWCTWAGLEVTIHVGATHVDIVGRDGTTVTHPRVRFGQRSIDYRHYLPELAKKPQALRQVACELVPTLGEPFVAAWSSLCDAHGPRQAARIFAKVLGHVERRGVADVARVVAAALRGGEPLLLALAPALPTASLAVTELPAALRAVDVASGRAADYDVLLAGAR